ncbi:MAG: nucleoside-diphosphate sugar epimerase/dehydratase [Treponema sp.]
MKSFPFDKKKLLIYGAGSIGLKMVNQNGIIPCAFIDRRGDELKKFNGYDVYSVKQADELKEKDSYCIIIAIRDVFSHSQIAMDFFNNGFKNLIFKPYSVLCGKINLSEELSKISASYDSLTVQGIDIIQIVPCYNGEILFSFENKSLIRQSFEGDDSSEFVRFYAPSELLFSNDLYDDSNLWTKRNFLSNYIAVDLYRALQENSIQKNEEFERYVNLYAISGAIRSGVNITGSWKNTVIETRVSAFNEMKSRLATDNNFFIKHCTTVSLLAPCRLQLIKSGKSRVSFLTALRMPYIPVLMRKDEYEKFLNEAVAKNIYEYICKANILKCTVPVPHPFFYELKAEIPDYAYLWESKVARILYDLSFERNKSFDTDWLTICDVSCDNGSISRYLKNLGFQIYRKKFSDKFTFFLDRLFYMENNFDKKDCKNEANCLVYMSLYENFNAEQVLKDICIFTKFVFVFLESDLIEPINIKLKEEFESISIANTIVCGKSFKGIYFRRK